MGLLDNTTQQQYYSGNDLGNYQFVSLNDIINQFMIAYVGEEKIISKASRTDIAFHAQRALAELSFDTFKSTKSQEIEVNNTLTMILPHDYVNYTKISWVDASGLKHPLYPTKHTSNPTKITQNDDGSYDFTAATSALLNNNDFSDSSAVGLSSTGNPDTGWVHSNVPSTPTVEDISIVDEVLTFTHGSNTFSGSYTGTSSRAYACWQRVEVTGMNEIDISATGSSAAASSGVKDAGVLRVGVTTLVPDSAGPPLGPTSFNPNITNLLHNGTTTSSNCVIDNTEIYNLTTTNGVTPSYVEFKDGAGTASTSTLNSVDVSGVPFDTDNKQYVYLLIVSFIPNFTTAWTSSNNNESKNTVDDISITFDGLVNDLQTNQESTSWSRYKSSTPSENVNDDYTDNYFWPNEGRRYGLEPSHAQVNGSFYIDEVRGNIHFSSNVNGKTVVLDYISDSLGTDDEMKVHKLAEEAMYKCIAYAVLSTRINTPEYIVQRYKKERFAATRQAKLRLSNIKLEEITQILRGKSKHIKH